MIWSYIILAFVSFCGMRFSVLDGYDPLDRRTTTSIKGIFISMVFITHMCGYIPIESPAYAGLGGYLFWTIRRIFGQLIVVMFLFYSGYGVMASIQSNGQEYVRTMPKKRILTTLLNFDVAVLLFVIVDFALGVDLQFGKTILAFTGWTSVGNSNWYIFVILACYLIAWICGVVKGARAMPILAVTVMMMLVLSFVKESWWYNTMMAFPCGCVYASQRTRIDDFIKRRYWSVLAGCSVTFLLVYGYNWLCGDFHGLVHNLMSVLFAALVIILSFKVKIGNPVLYWLGANLFPIYIYQRIPMLMGSRILGSDFISTHWVAYVIGCVIITLAIAWAYPWWRIRLGATCVQ